MIRLDPVQFFRLLERVALPVAVGLLVTIVIRTVTESQWLVLGLVIACVVICFIIKNRSTTVIEWLFYLLIGLVVGGVLPIESVDNTYQPLFGERVEVAGVVSSDTEYRGSYQLFYVKPEIINSVALDTKLPKLLITTDVYQSINYGDRVLVSGVIQPIENFTTDSGRDFSYTQYLLVRGVAGQISYARISPTNAHQSSIRRTLARVKSHYLSILGQRLPEPHVSLAGGITVGANDALGEEIDSQFRRVGLTHIVVLSGYNVAIIILALATVLAFLPYWLAGLVSFSGIWLFVLLVGASTTIVRAGIMASIAVVSRLYGSEISGLSLLSLAVIVMSIHQPLIVVHDPSFQLSVLATLGIVVVAPIIEVYATKLPTRFGWREVIVTTLATQVTVIPWIVYLMGEFSMVSLVANVLVLPIVPLAMAAVFLIYVFHSWLGILSSVATAISFAALGYIFFIARVIGSWQFASISVPPISFSIIVFVYLVIALLLFKVHTRNIHQKLY